MSFNLAGKAALITGGASGLGYCMVRVLFKNGVKNVAILDVDEVKGQEVESEFKKEFGESSCIFIKTDVSEEKEMRAAFELTVKTFKHLDIVINNAAVLEDINWKKCLTVNLGGCMCGTILAIDEYLPKYKSGDEGVIINIASVAGLMQFGGVPVYSATKHGIIALSRNFGDEKHYERTKVKVIAVCPGHMLTPMLMQPSFNPEYIKLFKLTADVFPVERPEVIAEAMPDILRNGSTGSVWVVEGTQKPYTAEYKNLRRWEGEDKNE